MAGRNVSLTRSASNPQANYTPEPLNIVGDVPTGALPHATTSAYGTVKKAATQADFAGADLAALKVELNAWLVKLKDAGLQA